MEIVTYVLSGALAHKDSMGTGSTIARGEVQRMSAGTGVLHSEYNASEKDPVHFLQIWFLPERRGLEPGYEQRKLDPAALDGKLALVVSKDGRDGSLRMNQDASLHAARLAAGQKVRHELAAGRSAWVHVATGSVVLGGRELHEGDGAAITDEKVVELAGTAAGGVSSAAAAGDGDGAAAAMLAGLSAAGVAGAGAPPSGAFIVSGSVAAEGASGIVSARAGAASGAGSGSAAVSGAAG